MNFSSLWWDFQFLFPALLEWLDIHSTRNFINF
jgi:hypothetical protein